ncbi:MAG: right-handed parallel beta-helix repeat-containing protein [Candidatus Eisenbacteria bacterium]|nr:right-handed parallel beta-helix repeat-containing protein [Candidatus Eisenbacteria bacterium]
MAAPDILRRSAGLIPIVVATILAAIPTPLHALAITVRPDGTGDVSTFQAGVDSMLLYYPGQSPRPDTMIVEAGDYNEVVNFDFDDAGYVIGTIICSAGPARTSLRGVEFNAGCTRWECESAQFFKVIGLRILTPVEQGPYHHGFLWRSCEFTQGYRTTYGHRFMDEGGYVGCLFRGRADIEAPGVGIDSCSFIGGTTTFGAFDTRCHVSDCVFTGNDTALIIRTGYEPSLTVQRCSFEGVGTAIALPQPISSPSVLIEDCAFANVRDAAIDVREPPGPCEGGEFDLDLDVRRCTMNGCGAGIRVQVSCRTIVSIDSVTVTQTRGVGIEARVGRFSFDHLTVSDGAADGIRVASSDCRSTSGSVTHTDLLRNRGDGFICRDTVPNCDPSDFAISDSRSAENGGAGLRIEGSAARVHDNVIAFNGGPGIQCTMGASELADSLSRNTCVRNGGAGIEVVVGPGTQKTFVENNLVAGNHNPGIAVIGAYAGDVRHNDAWRNLGGAYLGLAPAEGPNLTLDPRFCDVSAGDFHLASSSPCAATGPFGPIGALGVGCDISRIAVQVNKDRARGDLAVALLGDPLFDALGVDPGSVTLAGAAPRRSPRPEARDVNGDGVEDLVLRFDGRALDLSAGGDARLRAITQDGTPVIGDVTFDGVGRRRGVGTFDSGAIATADSPPVLALRFVRTDGTSAVRIALSLANHEPATLELIDVAGRRVATWSVSGPTPGPREVDVRTEVARRGIYFVRLRQGAAQSSLKAVLIN